MMRSSKEKPQRYFTTGIDRARYHVHAVLRRGLQFTFQSKRNDTCISEQFRLCVGSNYELFWFTSLRSVIGLKKLAPNFQPIGWKTKTNPDLVISVFPRLKQFPWFWFGLLLANWDIILYSDWSMWFLWSWSHDIQSKSSLLAHSLAKL